MTMNIYITKDNEEKLRQYGNESSMSGLINSLLDTYFGQKKVIVPNKVAKGVTPGLTKELEVYADRSKLIDLPACCKQARPCKHWSYDPLNETWTNVISGEVKTTV